MPGDTVPLFSERNLRLDDGSGDIARVAPEGDLSDIHRLLVVTGMRVGEAIGLDRYDFDVADGLLTIRSGKFGKSRELPLHPPAP